MQAEAEPEKNSCNMTTLHLKIKEANVRREKAPLDLPRLLQEEEILQKYIEERERKAFEKGFSEGNKQGTQKRNEELTPLMKALEGILEKFKFTKEDIANQAGKEALLLAQTAFRKLNGEYNETFNPKIIDIIQPVLQKIPNATRLIIKLNPQDFKIFSEFKDNLTKIGQLTDCEIVQDSQITKGGCFIETDIGMIDATLETRVDKISDAIKE